MAPDSQPDYYAVLGVQPEIGFAELRRVWRRLARRWHPDHAGPASTAAFQKINAAYEVLSDPIARAAYDRRQGNRRGPPDKPAAGSGPRRKAPGVALRRLCGPLNSLLACGVARRIDNVIEILPSAQEAASGGMITISLRVPVRCPACARSPLAAACQRCGNTRTVEELFSAWLAMPPDVADGTILIPSALLPGMLQPLTFRVRLRSKNPSTNPKEPRSH
ncbi:MAG TPA: DnaJ domain-containing protein [Verrucomicrobiae bacterium]|nr:DnaJ domain-containing protein [Verrucomicrobiae bacterium]